MKMAILATLIVVSFSGEVQAGCGRHLIEEALSGQTFSANNHPQFPTKLTLNSDFSAVFGSALDGHPGGVYTWNGLCNGSEIVLSFKSALTHRPAQPVMHLHCAGQHCQVLKDKKSGWEFSLE